LSFFYKSGEEIKRGDRIKLDGHPGRVEFIVTHYTGDPAMDWYIDEFGGGIGIIDDDVGNVFLSIENIKEDEGLEFVSRVQDENG
jgi:hypothetical protein